MALAFFGLTPSDKEIALEHSFILMYYMGFSYSESYNLPIRYRTWFIERMKKEIEKIKNEKIKIDAQEIKEILTVNGVRFSFEDGSWGLIRASSNKPSLVVVTESPTSDDRKKKIFDFIDDLLQKTGKIGEYDQKI